MDLERFPVETAAAAGGIPEDGLVYYTSGLSMRAKVSPLERLRLEGSGHPLLDAGTWTVVHAEREPEVLSGLLPRILLETDNVHLAWTPEFTLCRDCRRLAPGLSPVCAACGSSNVEELTRVADGYGPLLPRSPRVVRGGRTRRRACIRFRTQDSGFEVFISQSPAGGERMLFKVFGWWKPRECRRVCVEVEEVISRRRGHRALSLAFLDLDSRGGRNRRNRTG